ncbi:MAG: ATP-binding cassette domain-containing protein, partial [Holophagales bacterium]|nr:ATP-binding cassette domain-containing protein [Holophagales bacterium]
MVSPEIDSAESSVPPTAPDPTGEGASDEPRIKLEVRDLRIRYGEKVALDGASFDIREHEIFGIIGPAGSGKTSFLRVLNRMDLFDPAMEVEGEIVFEGHDVRRWRNVYALRRRIGVVFPLPVGLPLSVYDNVALSPRLRGVR